MVCARASELLFSPLLTRQFSSRTTWPGATCTPFSTQPAISGTSRPSSSARRRATGASESSGLNSPSTGRPRCDVTMTAAPASSAALIAGTDARMRVSSVIAPLSSCGTLRSARIKTRLPASLPSAIKSDRRNTWFMGVLCTGFERRWRNRRTASRKRLPRRRARFRKTAILTDPHALPLSGRAISPVGIIRRVFRCDRRASRRVEPVQTARASPSSP